MEKNEIPSAAQALAKSDEAIKAKRGEIRGTCLYGSIKSAVAKAIDEEAGKGSEGVCLPSVTVPGELGQPEKPLGRVLSECEDAVAVAETLVEDLEAQGYRVARLLGVPFAVVWARDDEKKG